MKKKELPKPTPTEIAAFKFRFAFLERCATPIYLKELKEMPKNQLKTLLKDTFAATFRKEGMVLPDKEAELIIRKIGELRR